MEPRIDAFLRSHTRAVRQPDTRENYKRAVYFMSYNFFPPGRPSVTSEDVGRTSIAQYIHTKLLQLYPLSCNQQHPRDVLIVMDRRELIHLRQEKRARQESNSSGDDEDGRSAHTAICIC